MSVTSTIKKPVPYPNCLRYAVGFYRFWRKIFKELFGTAILHEFTILSLALLALSCVEDPPTQIIPVLGKRDYTWTVDTLAYPGSFQTNMYDMWASSSKDVYVVGHNDRGYGKMYHYDGNSWSPVKLLVIEGGGVPTAPIDLSGVFGFAPNDVWAVGEHIYQNPNPPPNFLDSSLIIHFDGTSWKEIPVAKGRQLSCVWGSAPSDVWFGGAWGSLYHFDGIRCTKMFFDTLTSFNFMTGFSSSSVYATCARKIDFDTIEDSLFYLLYHYDGTSWMPVDSFMITPYNVSRKFGLSLWASPQGNLYSATYGVYRFLGNGSWQQLVESDVPIRVWGSSEINIFAVGRKIYHWNGNDWIRLSGIEYPTRLRFDTWTNNVETFIVGNDGLRTFILHGK
ncbi:MAG: hypothetical protein EPO24_01225 [Bacteroidetes bacterium]|nr:MAG: hypothetical protein EPO24_01225 [Bacteroidota bacterium]